MKACPFCREEIQSEAIKCKHCGSLLVPMPGADPKQADSKAVEAADSRQVTLILDRGFLYFAKFVAAAIAILIAAGAAFFGFDLNRAREDAEAAKAAVEKTQKEMQAVADKAQASAKEAQNKLEETERKLADIEATAVNEHVEFQKKLQIAATGSPSNGQGTSASTAASHSYTMPEIAKLYRFPAGLDGSGKTIGLLELGGGYRQADIDHFFSVLQLASPAITAVAVDSGGNHPDSSGTDGQVEGDIEVSGAIAPKAKIRVYFAPNTNQGFVDAVKAATRDHVSVLSISWGSAESSWSASAVAAMQAALQKASLAGITVVVAAGDSGATEGVSDGQLHVDYPASSEWVLAVGGTRLESSNGAITSETVWNSYQGNRGATGGGVSGLFSLPDWQQSTSIPPRKDGTKGRGLPDVAANADPNSGYQLFVDGSIQVVGGTAMATPLWAGLVALLDQGLGHDIGYFNPRLYTNVGPAKVLRLITSGNNSTAGVEGFSAGPGWSAVAGWGSPDGDKLLAWLRAH